METQEDKDIYARIMFTDCDTDAQLENLKEIEQKKGLARYLSQKICFQAVFKPVYKDEPWDPPDNVYHPPSFLSLACCCFYPEQYTDVFGVTTKMFKEKLIRVFSFWRNDYLEMVQVDEQEPDTPPLKPDLYGPVWLIVTYSIVLAIASNLNDYFSLPNHNAPFIFQTTYVASAISLNLIYLFPAIMGCLDGALSTTESAHLVGYSTILYIIPSLLCIYPNQTSHTVLLLLAAVIRSVFMARNLASRCSGISKGIIYFVIIAIQFLEYVIMSGAFFTAYAGHPTAGSTAPVAVTTVIASPTTTGHPLTRTTTTTTPTGTAVA